MSTQPDWIKQAAEEAAARYINIDLGDKPLAIKVRESLRQDLAKLIAESIRKHFDSASPWVKTSERPPTEKDADRYGVVMAVNPDGSVFALSYFTVKSNPERYKLWTPIPPLPVSSDDKQPRFQEKTKTRSDAARRGEKEER